MKLKYHYVGSESEAIAKVSEMKAKGYMSYYLRADADTFEIRSWK